MSDEIIMNGKDFVAKLKEAIKLLERMATRLLLLQRKSKTNIPLSEHGTCTTRR